MIVWVLSPSLSNMRWTKGAGMLVRLKVRLLIKDANEGVTSPASSQAAWSNPVLYLNKSNSIKNSVLKICS